MVTKALTGLNNEVHWMCELDGVTCNKIMNAWYKEFSCNGTEAAKLAAEEAATKFINGTRHRYNLSDPIEGEVTLNSTNEPNNVSTPANISDTTPAVDVNATNAAADLPLDPIADSTDTLAARIA
jgi:hypothetical protein